MKTAKFLLLLVFFQSQTTLGQIGKRPIDSLQAMIDSIQNNDKNILNAHNYINDSEYRVLWDTALWDAGEFLSTTRKLKVPITPLASVSDFAKALTDRDTQKLINFIISLSQKTKRKIVLITVPSAWTKNKNFEDFIKTLNKFWNQNNPDMKQGYLAAISYAYQKISIQAGLEISNSTIDKEIKSIEKEIIYPEFKKNQFLDGVMKGLTEIVKP